MKLKLALIIVVTSIALTACSSFQAYDGPPRPDNETALVKTTAVAVDSAFSGQGAVAPAQSFLTSTDDRDLPNVSEVRLLPGGRCVTLRLVYTPNTGDTTSRINSELCFDAVAGKTYEVRVRIPNNQAVRTWLVDLETGATVSEGQFLSS